jgi:hypothetical protein
MRQIKCESCLYGDMKIGTAKRPPYANARYTELHQVLLYWCEKKSRFIAKIVCDCDNYQPDPKKIQVIDGKRYKQNALL